MNFAPTIQMITLEGFLPPHRGFETFTYMIEGHLQHEDSMGNSGELKSGEMQWMTGRQRHYPFRNAVAKKWSYEGFSVMG